MNPLLDAAIAYAARGWAVLPCEPGGKRPAARLVRHGLKEATTDADTIRRWWNAQPRTNVALVTGRAFDALDVDGDAGWNTLAGLTARHGCLSSSPVSLTPSGGAHYVFRATGYRNRVGFRPALDWRGGGGYVVAPPSVGANGVAYEWAVSPDEQPIEAAPGWLIDLLHKHATPTTAAGMPVRKDTATYARGAVERELGRLLLAPVGTRNDQLNRSAHALGQLVGARMLSAAQAGDALFATAVRIGLSEDEAVATIQSGMAAGIRCPRKVAS